MAYRVNAGPLPADHWTNDLARGGGRLKGEGCHFIDFLCDQAGSDPVTVSARGFPSRPDLPLAATDNFSVEIGFADGGVGTLHYAADAPVGPGKERFETSSPGVFAELEDYRRGRDLARAHGSGASGAGARTRASRRSSSSSPSLRGGGWRPRRPRASCSPRLATLAAARSLESGHPETVVSSGERDLRAEPAPGQTVEAMAGHGR